MDNYKREILINNLVELGYLKTPRIIEAFRNIDRADFVPTSLKHKAYDDAPLFVSGNHGMPQPLIVAYMMELLHLRAGDRVLQIGTGLGWQTALLVDVVHQGGQENNNPVVVSLEKSEELTHHAINAINQYGFVSKGIVSIIHGDPIRGCDTYAPYDKIICTTVLSEIPVSWKEQLKIGGTIVAVVENSVVVMEKTAKNEFFSRAFWGHSVSLPAVGR